MKRINKEIPEDPIGEIVVTEFQRKPDRRFKRGYRIIPVSFVLKVKKSDRLEITMEECGIVDISATIYSEPW